ncbi:MAG: Hsp33 family molecular chaperone HslO [Desulfuromonadales bacterium]|jgi:molecular chaperone Hsp33
MKDHLVRILTGDGSLRAMAAMTTSLVEETRRRQGTDPTATVALGRLVTGAALMGSLLKGDQRLALLIEGNGPLQKLHAETDAYGHLRGSVKNPVCSLPLREGRFDVAGAIGRAGFLHVIKDLGLKEPYRGMVQLYRSTVAQDLAYYFTASEQVPSTVALGVYVEPDGRVSAAGGFMVQVMPGGDEALISLLEKRLSELPPTTALLREGLGPLQILERIFSGVPFAVKATTDLAFRCGCSRQQVRSMLLALEKKELQELTEREEETVVTCEYCKESYRFSVAELKALIR